MGWGFALCARNGRGGWLLLCVYGYNESHIETSVARSVWIVKLGGMCPNGFVCVFWDTRIGRRGELDLVVGWYGLGTIRYVGGGVEDRAGGGDEWGGNLGGRRCGMGGQSWQ